MEAVADDLFLDPIDESAIKRHSFGKVQGPINPISTEKKDQSQQYNVLNSFETPLKNSKEFATDTVNNSESILTTDRGLTKPEISKNELSLRLKGRL